jgi:hypothetical protein
MAIPQRTQVSVRSGVTVMHQSWPLAKGNGFILILVLVSEYLPGIGALLALQLFLK